ncbi:hypothetical protein [Nocardia sp. NPDC057668]|uniref:hypothetical protein n=1 Tax=Nocardia sp. NPDC057668 TaxID=3346202 RepID=UPI00366C461B
MDPFVMAMIVRLLLSLLTVSVVLPSTAVPPTAPSFWRNGFREVVPMPTSREQMRQPHAPVPVGAPDQPGPARSVPV